MSQITTITLNPSVDASCQVQQVIPVRKLRCTPLQHHPGGGGLNVARAIQQLGGSARALWTCGGVYGRLLHQLLDEEGLVHEPLEVAGSTRENFIAFEESSGHLFRTHCDTEVLPHLYEAYGDDFVQRINGQFAVALWDTRKQKLVLARDRLGIKPLFYQSCGRNLRFASEIKAILAGAATTPDLNLEAVYHYLSFKYVPAPLTIYQGIASVLPGEQLIFHDGRLTKRRYWDLNHKDSASINVQDAVDHLDHLLRASMKRRLVSDVPVGALLSGGVDSSLIVALASEFSGTPVQTFTLGYEEDFAYKQQEKIPG